MIICQLCGDVIGVPGVPTPDERRELFVHRARHTSGELPERSVEEVIQAYDRHQTDLQPVSDVLPPLLPLARVLAQSIAEELVDVATKAQASSIVVGVTVNSTVPGESSQFWIRYKGDIGQIQQLGREIASQTASPTPTNSPPTPAPKDLS